jgi:hypothetical protein
MSDLCRALAVAVARGTFLLTCPPACPPARLQVEVVHDASPSGIAVDPSRASIYYTSAERGAGLTWSNYDGRYPPPKQVIPQGEMIFFEPVAVALNPVDGSVYVVQSNTYVEGCDPTSDAGLGAVVCDEREQGRISRVSLAPKMDAYCMRTACALRVHCMRTACVAHCVQTACTQRASIPFR